MADSKSIAMSPLRGGGGGGSGAGAFRVVHSQDPLKNRSLEYPNNAISNTKYTLLTFLPKNLLEQFSLNINRYFLIIAILQIFTVLTPVNPLSTWGPLIVIFAISAAKEATDDWSRRNEDKLANERTVTVFRNTVTGYQKTEAMSQDISVGDILYLREDEQVPCDILLLKSSGADGSAFITTTNLDGETNLKQRQAPQATRDKTEEEIHAFRGVVKCPTPNRQLYAFDAQLYMEPSNSLEAPKDQEPVPISAPQLIQQTTSIRNTEWVYGLVVYTGNQTKFGNNKGIPPVKLTKVDLFINLMSIYVFIFQLGLVIIFGAIGENLRRSHIPHRLNGDEGLWYLYPPGSQGLASDASYEPVVIPLRFLLLNSTMIPISLKITLDLCKLSYAKFIGWDLQMYDKENKGGAVANNTSISEDLGQIEYVLTDKTGTLTQNSMVFRQFSINGVLYGERQCGKDGELAAAIKEGRQNEVDLMRNLVLNNSVVPVQKNPDKPKASSPDEAALVEAARYLGAKLLARDAENVSISICDQKEQYRVRQELEFTSERKRMSVIVEDLKTHELYMFTKGADEALLDRLRADQNAKPTLTHLDAFADQGLRTLMYCYRKLTEEEFSKWQEEFKEANAALQDRQAKRERSYDNLEKDLVIQGGSAIEDKLQDDVAHTIDVLRAARVKFWMLTGDKYSTALQIATACNLKSPEDRSILCSIEGSTKDAVGECIRVYLKELKSHGTARIGSIGAGDVSRVSTDRRSNSSSAAQQKREEDAALQADFKEYGPYNDLISEEDDHFKTDVTVIIRGSTLSLALEHHTKDFTKLCLMANTVICCRVAPSQKAELVSLVKAHGKMTLAIGDGGNDVAMIQAANIGVGIRGREGMQAARASDYQVANFRSLKYLLLVHGRYSYARTALVAQYSFYKSLCFCGIQIAYCFFSLFSGVSLFNSLSITGYNAILFFPIVTFLLDKDVPMVVALNHPILYRHAAKSHAFNIHSFLRWMLRAVVHATLLFAFTLHARGETYHMANHGFASDYETLGTVTFCGYLWVQSTTMSMSLHSLALFNVIFIWAFHFLCFLILWGTNISFAFQSLNPYYATTVTFVDLQFWLTNLLMLVACIAPVLAVETWMFNYRPTRADNLRYEHIVLGKSFTKFGIATANPSIGSGKALLAESSPLLSSVDSKTPRGNADEKSPASPATGHESAAPAESKVAETGSDAAAAPAEAKPVATAEVVVSVDAALAAPVASYVPMEATPMAAPTPAESAPAPTPAAAEPAAELAAMPTLDPAPAAADPAPTQ